MAKIYQRFRDKLESSQGCRIWTVTIVSLFGALILPAIAIKLFSLGEPAWDHFSRNWGLLFATMLMCLWLIVDRDKK